jgi:hypothetical protein
MTKMKPWIGPREGQFAETLKLLIFGESPPRNGDERKDPKGISAERLKEYLKHISDGGKAYPFFGTVDWILSKALDDSETDPDASQRTELWQRSSFTNLVPELVDGRPSEGQWGKIRDEFVFHVRDLKPDLVLVFSKEGDKRLPESIRADGSKKGSRYIAITAAEGLRCPIGSHPYIYEHEDGHKTLYGNFYHPRGMQLAGKDTGRSKKDWVLWARQLIAWAKELKKTGQIRIGDKAF